MQYPNPIVSILIFDVCFLGVIIISAMVWFKVVDVLRARQQYNQQRVQLDVDMQFEGLMRSPYESESDARRRLSFVEDGPTSPDIRVVSGEDLAAPEVQAWVPVDPPQPYPLRKLEIEWPEEMNDA